MTRSQSQGKKRNRAIRASHRQTIAELRLKGISIVDIVRTTRVSMSTVKRELRSLAAEWREAAADATDVHCQRELARLEVVERQAWLEWERSKQDYSKQVTEQLKVTKVGEDIETEPKVVKRETGVRIGDPKFLQIILNAQEARRKLLGLDAPTKVAPTTPDGKEAYNPDSMTDDELDARIAELTAKTLSKAR